MKEPVIIKSRRPLKAIFPYLSVALKDVILWVKVIFYYLCVKVLGYECSN
jgi:hypothetical protein